MRKKHPLKLIIISIFLLLLIIPYLTHISQDLPSPVIWDEAQIHVNAKDIVLFGTSSLKNDVSYYIFFPLNIMLGLLSFPLLGNSLFSLRLPYILLNIIGNIFFFDLLRRTRGLLIAMITTLAFTFYAPRFIIGKAAMAESLTLPLMLFLLWCFVFVSRNPRLCFCIGTLGMLIFWTKLDNVFVPIFLTGLAAAECLKCWRKGNLAQAKRIVRFYLSGVALVAIIWLCFYLIVGWRNVLHYFSVELNYNLSMYPWQQNNLSPFTAQLFLNNINLIYEDYFGFFVVTVLCLAIFLLFTIFLKREHVSPLSLAIYLLLFLLIGKILISSTFFPRRIAPCYPLPFLLMAYITGFLPSSRLKQFPWRLSIKSSSISFLKKVPVCMFLLVLTFICYMPNALRKTLTVNFYPTYERVEEARFINSILDNRYKAIYFDGRFAYIDLQSPIEFIQTVADMKAEEEYLMISNPSLGRKLISENPDIGFAFFRPDNPVLKRMIEDEFGGELIADNVASKYGSLYRLPHRRY